MKANVHYSDQIYLSLITVPLRLCLNLAARQPDQMRTKLESGIYSAFPTKQPSKNCLVSILLYLSPPFDILRRVIAGEDVTG